MWFVRSVVAGGLGLGVCSSVLAIDRPYLAISGGMNFPSTDVEESTVTNTDGQPIPDDELSLKDGWDVAFAGGMHLSDSFRVELQYTAQSNDMDSITFESMIYGGPEFDLEGTFYSHLFMLNVYYDHQLNKQLSAYVGAGAGVSYITFDGSASAFAPDDKIIDNNSGASFAYQVMAGLAYEVMPNLYLTGGYRGWTSVGMETEFADLDMPWFHMAEVGLRVGF